MSSAFPNDRLRFAEFTLARLPNGRCRAHVGLTFKEAERFDGRCEGLSSENGELRCAAEACVKALTDAVRGTNGTMTFELVGVKSVRAFDATVVIVALQVRGHEHASRILGAYLTDNDPPRGAALAVLNATNRILGNLFVR